MDDHQAEVVADRHAITQSYKAQHLLAAEWLAENQCQECGAYRADGLPPVLHYRGCSQQWRGLR